MQEKLGLKDLAWPIFVENFLAKAMGMVNIYLISLYSEEAVAAIGVSNQLVNFIQMLFFFVTLGMTVVVSQNLGAGQRERAQSAAGVAVFLNLVIGLSAGLIVLLFHRPILQIMGLSGTSLSYAAVYFRLIGGFAAVQGLNLSLGAIMRNYGQARTPMMVFLGMNVLNLIGNSIIVIRPFGLPDLGIGGIAACTVFSQGAAALTLIILAARYHINLRIRRPMPWPMIREILTIGIPGAGDNLAYSIAQISLVSFITPLGTTAIASYTYAQSLIAFVQLLGYSIGQGSQIIVGRKAGARQFDDAYHFAFRGFRLALMLNLSVMFVLLLLQRPILGFFTDNPAILSTIFWCLLIDLVLEFGRPLNLVIGTCVRITGDVRWAIANSAASILLLCIPLGYLLTNVFHLGVPGIFLALCADEWLRGLLMAGRWRSRRWEKAVLIKQKPSLPVELPEIQEA